MCPDLVPGTQGLRRHRPASPSKARSPAGGLPHQGPGPRAPNSQEPMPGSPALCAHSSGPPQTPSMGKGLRAAPCPQQGPGIVPAAAASRKPPSWAIGPRGALCPPHPADCDAGVLVLGAAQAPTWGVGGREGGAGDTIRRVGNSSGSRQGRLGLSYHAASCAL